MINLRALIREQIINLFEDKEEHFNGMPTIASVVNGDQPIWEPLYEFLKNIFEDKYKQAANGFMWYGTYEAKPDLILSQYRHGITRKYIFLSNKGEPYNLNFEIDMEKREPFLKSIKKLTVEESFKQLYDNIINAVQKACKLNDCEAPEDIHLMSYNDYRLLRDKMMQKSGYNVSTIRTQGDIERFGDENLEEKWSKKYKKSINCSDPKGFSQKAHCAARKKRQRGEITKSKNPFK